MTTEEALEKLVESTAEAVSGVLESFCPGGVEMVGVTVGATGADPLGSLPAPLVAAGVSYVDGVTGGNVFAMSVEGARALAAAMMGMPAPEDDSGGELSELELSAVAEATNQMMAAAAAAISAVLGQEVEISPPKVGIYAKAEDVMADQDEAPHLARAHFSVAGAPARLLQLVPNAFIVRITRALDEMGAEYAENRTAEEVAAAPSATPVADSLQDVPVKVWAELGRARMQTGRLVALPPGAVVELDRRADDPVDIFVNGLRFATGRLIVVDGAEWAVRIEAVAHDASAEGLMEDNVKGVMG